MVELIPKKEKTAVLPRWVDILFYVAIVVFIITLLAFLILNRLKNATEKALENVQVKIEQIRTPERLAMEANLLDLEKKIKDVEVLLGSHYDASKFFTELEKVTHPGVQFTEISVDNTKFTVRLSGLAQDFTAVEQQFRILDQSDLFHEVKLSDLSVGKEAEQPGVKFLLSFTFDPEKIYK